MKLVYIAFDNVIHQPKLTNMISMIQKNKNFIIKSSHVNSITQLNKIYDTMKPDVSFDKR